MVIRTCDRCGEVINDNYWTIDIYEKEDNLGKQTTEGVINNTRATINKTFNKEKEFCKKCIEDIKKCIERGV